MICKNRSIFVLFLVFCCFLCFSCSPPMNIANTFSKSNFPTIWSGEIMPHYSFSLSVNWFREEQFQNIFFYGILLFFGKYFLLMSLWFSNECFWRNYTCACVFHLEFLSKIFFWLDCLSSFAQTFFFGVCQKYTDGEKGNEDDDETFYEGIMCVSTVFRDISCFYVISCIQASSPNFISSMGIFLTATFSLILVFY